MISLGPKMYLNLKVVRTNVAILWGATSDKNCPGGFSDFGENPALDYENSIYQ